MLSQLSTLLVAAALIAAGCQTQKSTRKQEAGTTDTTAAKLQTRLGVMPGTFTTDSVMLTFTVVNHSNQPQRFCKWETPFEPRLGKYFDVTDDKGNEAQFKGAMARRIMPPPDEAYITIAAHDSAKTQVNLAHNYTLAPGTHTVKYVGGGVSGLEAGNIIRVTVAQ